MDEFYVKDAPIQLANMPVMHGEAALKVRPSSFIDRGVFVASG